MRAVRGRTAVWGIQEEVKISDFGILEFPTSNINLKHLKIFKIFVSDSKIRHSKLEGTRMSPFFRLVLLLAAVAVALAPLMVVAQTQTAAKPWTPPKTPWGDPDIQGLWPGVDMVGTPLERDRALGTRAFLTEEEFAKKIA